MKIKKIPYITDQNNPKVKEYVKAVKKGLKQECTCPVHIKCKHSRGHCEPVKWEEEFDKLFVKEPMKDYFIVVADPKIIKSYIKQNFISKRELEDLANKIEVERCIPDKVKLIEEFEKLIKEQ